MPVRDEIETRLQQAFAPRVLEVVNESHMHTGHAGSPGTGESHFRVEIAAEVFSPLSRIARHRAVHSALGADLMGRIHALALQISD